MTKWGSDLPAEVQYPNDDDGGWMETYCEQSLADVQFDHDQFREWLKSADTTTILSPPLCGEVKRPSVKDAVNVDGELHRPARVVAKKKGKRAPRTRRRSSTKEQG
jgi:hypothetical protein